MRCIVSLKIKQKYKSVGGWHMSSCIRFRVKNTPFFKDVPIFEDNNFDFNVVSTNLVNHILRNKGKGDIQQMVENYALDIIREAREHLIREDSAAIIINEIKSEAKESKVEYSISLREFLNLQ